MKSFREWCLENKKYEMLVAYENAKNECKSDEIGFSTSKIVNWKCSNCGNEWSLSTNKMHKRENVCLYCAHKKASSFYNLETEIPILAREWNYERNSKKPTQYLPASCERVWWKCKEGHEFEGRIKDRTRTAKTNISKGKSICPYCNHERISAKYNLATEFPDIAEQWNYNMNGSLSPLEVSPKSKKKVWWTCKYDSNHIYQGRICNRTVLNRGCPICSKNVRTSFPEQAIYYYLKPCFNDCEMEKTILGQYILDIFIESYKIIIEYDGWYYHSSKESEEREKKRDQKLAKFNIFRIKEVKEDINEIICSKNTIKYHPKENYNNLDEVIKELLKLIEETTKVKMQYDINCKRDNKQIRTMYYHTRKSRSLAVKRPELTKEWSDNNDRSPDNVTLSSSYKAKWICPKCNREYISMVANRVRLHSNCPFCANKKVCKENSLAYCYPQISKEWNYEKNGDLLPENVIAGTDKKVWWKCEKGHEWQMRICSRTGKRHSGCPYCRQRYFTIKKTLEEMNPELKQIWNYKRNEGKTTKDFSYSSNKKVWWKCEKGHEWQMSINKLQRIKNEVKCPYCRNIKLSSDNSLAAKYKELSKQWNYEKNKNKKPENYLPSSKEKVWWKCEKGHEWETSIVSRVRKSGCPYCKRVKVSSENSLASNGGNLLKEWNYEKNKISPEKIAIYSGKKVWWKCKKGHEWQDSVSHRSFGRGCPYCSGRRVTVDKSIAKTHPKLKKEWNYEKNGDLKPEQVSKGSKRKVWWKCEKGHEWQAIIANRSRGQNCPICWKERNHKETIPKIDCI